MTQRWEFDLVKSIVGKGENAGYQEVAKTQRSKFDLGRIKSIVGKGENAGYQEVTKTQRSKFDLGRVKSIVGKGENAGYQEVSPAGLFNPFPNKPWFLRVYSTCLLKTLGKKDKLLVTSNLSFSHSVFYPFGIHAIRPGLSGTVLDFDTLSWRPRNYEIVPEI